MPGKFTFYSENIDDRFIVLDETEARHAIQVLRFQVDDNIEVSNGLGNKYAARIVEIQKRSLKAEIVSCTSYERSRVHLAVGILKNSDRMEWLVEKCTELGCHSIGFLETKNSERSKINLERLHKTAIAAMKQSHGAWIPKIHLVDWRQVLDSSSPLKFIAYCDLEDGISVKNHPHALFDKAGDVLICIGPEGDFTLDEFKLATLQGFSALKLGDHILRAETAAITACAWANWV
jgi:16S rRNA (uracil1498-N3)-methyltransferase